MNIFGIGGMELALILIIMLIVAGPKRMIRWAYVVGQYTAKFRKMWEETVDYIQKEVDEAGLDIEVPKEIPTKATLNREIAKVMKPVTAPVQEALDEVGTVKRSVANGVHIPSDVTKPASATKPATTPAEKPAIETKSADGASAATKPAAARPDTSKPDAPKPPEPAPRDNFGTWSGATEPQDREAST